MSLDERLPIVEHRALRAADTAERITADLDQANAYLTDLRRVSCADLSPLAAAAHQRQVDSAEGRVASLERSLCECPEAEAAHWAGAFRQVPPWISNQHWDGT